jgi:hypothetical protein
MLTLVLLGLAMAVADTSVNPSEQLLPPPSAEQEAKELKDTMKQILEYLQDIEMESETGTPVRREVEESDGFASVAVE